MPIAAPIKRGLRCRMASTQTFSTPLSISVGNRPAVTLTTTPSDGGFFKAGDVISFSGTATDAEDGTLPASAYHLEYRFSA